MKVFPDLTGVQLQEIKCEHCNSHLLNYSGDADLELLCLKCRWANYPMRKTTKEKIEGLKGSNFMQGALSHFCWKCHRLMFRSRGGDGFYVKRCKYCKVDNTYDTKLMRKGIMKVPSTSESEKSRKSIAL